MKLAAFIRKEFHRFFHDPRLIVTMLLPGLLIFVIYSLMGTVVNDNKNLQDYEFKAYVSGQSEWVGAIERTAEGLEIKLTFEETDDEETAKAAVEKGEAAGLLRFTPEGAFEIYYCSADETSAAFYSFVSAVATPYQGKDMSESGDIAMSIASAILPFIIVVFIFSACMSITLESVAGEKERGTLATVLVTSVKRSHIVLGKVIPLSCISAIGAASSFLGVTLSLPKLMGVSFAGVFGSLGFVGFLMLFLLIMSVVPLIVSLITVVSAYAKTVKEASAYTSVIMILTMVLSLLASFVSGIGSWAVAIPVLNAVVCMQGILTGTVPVWQSLVSVGLNVVYTALLVLLVAKMISSEKIMFGR